MKKAEKTFFKRKKKKGVVFLTYVLASEPGDDGAGASPGAGEQIQCADRRLVGVVEWVDAGAGAGRPLLPHMSNCGPVAGELYVGEDGHGAAGDVHRQPGDVEAQTPRHHGGTVAVDPGGVGEGGAVGQPDAHQHLGSDHAPAVGVERVRDPTGRAHGSPVGDGGAAIGREVGPMEERVELGQIVACVIETVRVPLAPARLRRRTHKQKRHHRRPEQQQQSHGSRYFARSTFSPNKNHLWMAVERF